jgi:hypothetical protein
MPRALMRIRGGGTVDDRRAGGEGGDQRVTGWLGRYERCRFPAVSGGLKQQAWGKARFPSLSLCFPVRPRPRHPKKPNLVSWLANLVSS